MARLLAEHLSVDFPLYHGESRSLKKTVLAAASGRLGEDRKHRLVVQALRDISVDLGSGDRLALVGPNGAGKTTLLRALAGIYEPVAGRVLAEGQLAALLDASQGMNPDLTGRENIHLHGWTNGMGRAAIAAMEADIRDFAELGQFIDLPVRTYSAGMAVRLGFALATAISPEILLMDEWILAGDASFMARARQRLEQVVHRADILVLSTHAPEIVLKWCNRAVWVEGGRIRAAGRPADILRAYLPPEQCADLMPREEV